MQRTAARRALGTGRSAQPTAVQRMRVRLRCAAAGFPMVAAAAAAGFSNGMLRIPRRAFPNGCAAAYRYDEESARRAADKHARHLALCADAVHDLVDLAVRTACRLDQYCGPQALNNAFSRSYRAAVSINGWPCAHRPCAVRRGPGLQVKTSEYRTINDDEIVPAKVCR
jgi:hypothetical protein